ncbi:MAG: pilus assembly protein [Chloroflexi bacterium]|nr:MAG: pilus assembly protein [Chloroflexota bacterium]
MPGCLNVAAMQAEARARAQRRRRGQSLVEFAISSTVLLLLAMGLIDLSRAFYYSVSLQGAARDSRTARSTWSPPPAAWLRPTATPPPTSLIRPLPTLQPRRA